MNELGSLIKRKREELGLSQEEPARILGYKHKSSINKIELGLADVPRTKVPAFAKALGMTPVEFSGWSEKRVESSFSYCLEPARRYSNTEDHRAAGLCRPQNCRIKQKSPGGCRGSLSLSCICWQHHHATPRIFSTLFKTSSGSRPEPFTLPAISCASTSAGSGSAGFAATPWMVQ